MKLVPRGEALSHSVLYLHITVLSTLALKLFRGEPAISEFDWNFSANHKSSPVIATNVRSALHEILLSLQPAHG